MSKPIINMENLEFSKFGKGEKFGAQRAPVSPQIGASKLGYAVVKLEPGKCAWPYHSHHVNEELFYILQGEGTLRHANESIRSRQAISFAHRQTPDNRTRSSTRRMKNCPISRSARRSRPMFSCIPIPENTVCFMAHSKISAHRTTSMYLRERKQG